MGAMVEQPVDLDRLREVCERYGVARLDVFGSITRGDARPGSDVDLLYSLAPDTRLGWGIEHLARELSAVLGRPVDLVFRRTECTPQGPGAGRAQTLYAA